MRRVLIISTTFFPDPTVSAIRMTQWCRHLPEHGWQPHVLCRYYGFEAGAEELAQHVHPDVRIEYLDRSSNSGAEHHAPRLQQLGRRVLSSWLLGGVFVPDPSIRFWRKWRTQILKRVRAIRPEVIITTSPPHSNHDIGLWLARETGVPWVADFRDPYLIDNRFKPTGLGQLRWYAHERFLESIYRRAWLITHAIPIQARWARRRLPFARSRIRILTNAFPMELLSELAKTWHSPLHRKSVLVVGTIPEPQQLPLARAVAQLARQGHDVELRLVGKIPWQKKKLEQILGDRFVATGYVPHSESIREVANASVLVNYLDNFRSESRLLSTKLFEYLASGKPVVAINSSRSERLLLRHTHGVEKLRNPSISSIATALTRALRNQSRDSTDVEEFRRNYNWTERSWQVATGLHKLVEFPPRSAPCGSTALKPLATVVISTRNRQELLRRPILSALNQSVPVEVIVADDGSTDGTAEMVRREFPQVRLIRHDHRRGLIVRRNECTRLASAPVIFSIDDDATYSSQCVVEQTLREFDDARVGAVAIPCIDVRKDHTILQRAPDARDVYVTDGFIGTAHAVRRDVFVKLGGYREKLVHQGEEKDFCSRLLDAGFVVRVSNADPIHHFESPSRDFGRMDFYGRRNDILFAWQNVPMPYLPFHLAATVLHGSLFAARSARHPMKMFSGMLSGFAECFRGDFERKPVASRIYRLSRELKKSGPLSLRSVIDRLPPLSVN